MFDGKVGSSRQVNFGGRRGGKADQKNVKDFVKDARRQRELRALERLKNQSATKVQSVFRSKQATRQLYAQLRVKFDRTLPSVITSQSATPCDDLLKLLLIFFDGSVDLDRLLSLIQIMSSIIGWTETEVSSSTSSSHATKIRYFSSADDIDLSLPLTEARNIRLWRLTRLCSLIIQLLLDRVISAYAHFSTANLPVQHHQQQQQFNVGQLEQASSTNASRKSAEDDNVKYNMSTDVMLDFLRRVVSQKPTQEPAQDDVTALATAAVIVPILSEILAEKACASLKVLCTGDAAGVVVTSAGEAAAVSSSSYVDAFAHLMLHIIATALATHSASSTSDSVHADPGDTKLSLLAQNRERVLTRVALTILTLPTLGRFAALGELVEALARITTTDWLSILRQLLLLQKQQQQQQQQRFQDGDNGMSSTISGKTQSSLSQHSARYITDASALNVQLSPIELLIFLSNFMRIAVSAANASPSNTSQEQTLNVDDSVKALFRLDNSASNSNSAGANHSGTVVTSKKGGSPGLAPSFLALLTDLFCLYPATTTTIPTTHTTTALPAAASSSRLPVSLLWRVYEGDSKALLASCGTLSKEDPHKFNALQPPTRDEINDSSSSYNNSSISNIDVDDGDATGFHQGGDCDGSGAVVGNIMGLSAAATEEVLQAYTLANGTKKLEYRINAAQLVLERVETAAYATDNTDGISMNSSSTSSNKRYYTMGTNKPISGAAGVKGGNVSTGRGYQAVSPTHQVIEGIISGREAFADILDVAVHRSVAPRLLRTALAAIVPLHPQFSSATSATMRSSVDGNGGAPMDVDDSSNSSSTELLQEHLRLDILSWRVLEMYTNILIFHPLRHIKPMSSSLSTGETKAQQKSEAASAFSILNILAFSEPHDPLATKLWQFLTCNLTGNHSTSGSIGHHSNSPAATATAATAAHGGSGGGSSDINGNNLSRHLLHLSATMDERLLHSNEEFKTCAARWGIPSELLFHYILSTVYLFCTVFSHQLNAVDDEELLVEQRLFKIAELREIVQFLKKWLYRAFWTEPLFDINSSFLDDRIIGATVFNAGGGEYHSSSNLINSSNVSSGSEINQAQDASRQFAANHLYMLKMCCQAAVAKLFTQLCIRNERRQYLGISDWQWPDFAPHELSLVDDDGSAGARGSSGSSGGDAEDGGGGDIVVQNSRVKALLTFIPQVVPFNQRVSILQAMVARDKNRYFNSGAGGGIAASLGLPGAGGSVRVQIHRDRIVEDAFTALHKVGAQMKGRVQVEFINEQGMAEAGIDGGGLYKEFMDSFAKAAFDPAFGLFVPTSHQLLTANPTSATVLGGGPTLHIQYFNFIGKMLGKALYEGILLESEFAGGMLNVLLGRSNQLDDLYYLDEQMYRSVMQLKHYANKGGDLASLELYFETTRNELGTMRTIELIPGGSAVKVDRSNVHAYIHRLAHFKQNIEAAEQSRAMLAGFRTLVPIGWVRMFNTQELQLLISGSRRSLDVAEMQKHVTYASGYHPSQPYIHNFWKILDDMSPEDQGNFLRFVTSCSRQPLLGFGQLNPPFCIQKIPCYASQYTGLEPPAEGEAPRLPSAATCMNLLKLPLYDSPDMLKQKLLYAVRSNSGFELS